MLVNARVSVSVNPRLHSSIKPHNANSLISQNPVLHQSNRIVTSGLLSSVGAMRTYSNGTTMEFGKQSTFPTNRSTSPQFQQQNQPQQTQERSPQLRIMKADQDVSKGKGVIFRYYNGFVTLQFFQQNQELGYTQGGIFDYQSPVAVSRLSLNDLGRCLTVLSGTTPSVSINKKTGGVESTLTLTKHSDSHYVLNINSPSGSKVETSLNQSDATLLVEFLRCSVRSGLGF